MQNTFNLFRLNCMMDDNKSKNYNAIIVSLVFELIYEKGNTAISIGDCYNHLINTLDIKIDKDLFISLIDSNASFIQTSGEKDVFLQLTKDKFDDIDSKVHNHSIESHIANFIQKYNLNMELKSSVMELLNQSLYENVNSFSISNIKSILPQTLKDKFQKEEIDVFNRFLDDEDHQKNIALFNVFLKAVEFAIITSGKGVKQFTKDIFTGKEYCLDSNIIFRLLGVNGEERKDTLIKLIEACIHQGIKFKYCIDTYKEVVKKINSIIVEINHGIANNSLQILEEIIRNAAFDFNNGFIVHYAQCKIDGIIRSPEQYQVKLMADFRTFAQKYNIDGIDAPFKADKVDFWQNRLYDKKREINPYTHYSKGSAKVDAINILLVRQLRGNNNYNYSDIVSFYLTTDRTLNNVMANENKDKIAETILPSQLFILHNALSENEDERDYKAFNKFLKRRTTEFNQSGKAVLHYIDELRNITTNPESIQNILKAYSDKKYEDSLSLVDTEPHFKSIKEFAETQMDKQIKDFKEKSDKYDQSQNAALNELPSLLQLSKKNIRALDTILTIALLPITIVLMKTFTEDLLNIILATLFVEIIKFTISTKTKIFSSLTRYIFLRRVKATSLYKVNGEYDNTLIDEAIKMVSQEINIWK